MATDTHANPEVRFEEIDLTDLGVFEQRCPHDWFRFLRENAPVWKHPANERSDNEPFWCVTSYEHIKQVHRSGTLYSHQTGPGRNGAGGIALNDIQPEQGPGLQLAMTDPPGHTRYRKLVNRGFTPRVVHRLADAFRLRTTAILDRITPLGHCDFVTSVAAELPLIAIAEIVGVPLEDREQMFEWSNRAIGGSDDHDDAYAALFEMGIYAHGLTERKRLEPADDLWTKLTEAVVTMEDGTRVELTEAERDLFFILLIIAGNETTRNSISKGMLAFFDNPDQWQRWLAHPELTDTMVDEVLRYSSPVNFFRRTATADAELGGQHIAAGEKVLLWYPSGNRDEAEFGPTADTFDIGRTPNHHMAFGAGGAHFCLGANLAKLEIKIIFEELAKRTPDIALSGEVKRLRTNFVDSTARIPVEFTPSPALLESTSTNNGAAYGTNGRSPMPSAGSNGHRQLDDAAAATCPVGVL
ncbi:MAG: cytochrome P450 [Acidimicrobiaceae bacterium]|nr:cytochrome P450 [Acidimicrobiia bacterium]MCY4492880.1 cytochrome P450 [Acidimicrobiaceae bacterium]